MKILISVSATTPEAAKKSKAALKEYNALVKGVVKLRNKRDAIVAKLKAKKMKVSDSAEVAKIKKEIEGLLAKRTKLLEDLKKNKISLPKFGRAYITAAPGKSRKTLKAAKPAVGPEYKKLLEELSDVEADMEELRDDRKTSSRAYKTLEAKQNELEIKLKAFKNSPAKRQAEPKAKAEPQAASTLSIVKLNGDNRYDVKKGKERIATVKTTQIKTTLSKLVDAGLNDAQVKKAFKLLGMKYPA